MVAHTVTSLTSGRVLARSTAWNLLGQLLPMAVGVVAVPLLVRGLGVSRFGILSLAWIVVGYLSLFDLGTGRALTKLVADKLGANQRSLIPPLVWTSLLLMLLLGVAASLVALGFSPWLVHHALQVPPELQKETQRSFYVFSISIPLITLMSGLRGVLEALQRFRVLNLIRIPMNVFFLVGPLLTLPFSRSLVAIALVLTGGRAVALFAHLLACFQAMPALGREPSVDRSVIKPLFNFGGWITVTNVVYPLMMYLDRFVISALLSVTMVAYYAAPADLLQRLTVIPAAIAGVLFPAFAVSLSQDRERTGLLFSRGVKYILLAIFPVAIVLVALAPEGLRLWLGPTFAQNGSFVLRWLALGLLVNAIAHVPFFLIQTAGRPDIGVKLQLAELVLYLPALWLLTAKFGIRGTAVAATVRMAVEALILFVCCGRLLPYKPGFLGKLAAALAGAGAALGLALVPTSLPAKAVFLVLVLAIFVVATWRWALGPGERTFLVGLRNQAFSLRTKTLVSS